MHEIVEEVAHLVHGGVREVTLLGQTVEAYGHDLAGNARPRRPDGARCTTCRTCERIRFLTSYPKDMTPKIIEAVRDLPKVCEFFNIPVQSGSDAVLDRMRRGYTIAEYREKVDLIRSLMPEASITTDVIVGFCGETEAEFDETLRPARRHALRQGPRRRLLAASRHDRRTASWRTTCRSR